MSDSIMNGGIWSIASIEAASSSVIISATAPDLSMERSVSTSISLCIRIVISNIWGFGMLPRRLFMVQSVMM